jgi:hypothetical protein
MSFFESWQPRWYGLWRDPDEDAEGFPLFEELVDPDWNPKDRDRLIAYLEAAPAVLASEAPAIECKLCGVSIGDPSAFGYDGEWIWPCSLAHYVRKHDLRLPDTMVDHIRELGYEHPVLDDVRIEDLPLPR